MMLDLDGEELVSAAEVATRLGLKRSRQVLDLRLHRFGFPRPVARTGRNLVWSWPQVASWAETEGFPGASAGPVGRHRRLRTLGRWHPRREAVAHPEHATACSGRSLRTLPGVAAVVVATVVLRAADADLVVARARLHHDRHRHRAARRGWRRRSSPCWRT